MRNWIVASSLCVIFLSCEKKIKESQQALVDSGSLEESQRKIEEKRLKGDTLAMPYEQLAEFLPSRVEGYTEENKGTGQTVNEDFSSWSMVEKKYVKGNQRLIITLADYNGAYGLYAGATALLQNSGTSENDEEIIQLVSLKGGRLQGRTSFIKDEKDANLVVGIKDRFLITIWADHQSDAELVKRTFESINWDLLVQ